jgi:hypothetical protein
MTNPRTKIEKIFLAETGTDITIITEIIVSPNQLPYNATLLSKDLQIINCQILC